MRMRCGFAGLVVLLLLACRSPKTQIEPGAALLHVKTGATDPMPDALRVWVYDASGVLWNGERVPKDGALASVSRSDLGTVLLQPGQHQGALAIHMVGMRSGTTVSDGVLTIASLSSGTRTFVIVLSSRLAVDTDGDGVPDGIDDCPTLADPDQHGKDCSVPGRDDASVPPSNRDAADSAEAGDSAADDDLADGPADAVTKDEATVEDLPIVRSDGAGDGSTIMDGRDAADVVDALGPEAKGDGPDDLATSLPDTTIRPDGPADGPSDVIAPADGPLRCDAPGACGKAQGSPCASNAECTSGFCADGVCCTNACVGACRSCNQPSSVGTCQGYASGTDPEHECTSGATCNGAGACGALPTNLPNGQLCRSGSQCTSRNCKDGVCCNTPCAAPCEACGTGTCTTVKRADDAPECSGILTCNGAGNCVLR